MRDDVGRQVAIDQDIAAGVRPPERQVEQQRRAIQLLTISEVPGRVIDSSVGIVFGDYAFAYGAIYEELAGLLRNIGGSGRSTKTHTMLQEARETVLGQMREQALLLGADFTMVDLPCQHMVAQAKPAETAALIRDMLGRG